MDTAVVFRCLDQDSIKPHWEVRNGCCNQRILDEKSQPNSSSNVDVDVVVVIRNKGYFNNMMRLATCMMTNKK